ncbi:hypothetical protein RRG08_017079 [Elysia crispata]|uniref:Uncharacterized protein n=1 Tax=Elysia crispata TaxID=231223 RepID=A0AAE1DNP7_9GAST|nr:hypothetical protein RRG08_017079 [Elysia crispata]
MCTVSNFNCPRGFSGNKACPLCSHAETSFAPERMNELEEVSCFLSTKLDLSRCDELGRDHYRKEKEKLMLVSRKRSCFCFFLFGYSSNHSPEENIFPRYRDVPSQHNKSKLKQMDANKRRPSLSSAE